MGAIVEGKVRNLTDFGAFIEIEDGIDGLVHVSNLSWTKRVKHPSEVLKKGDKVKAIVLAIEPDQRRLSLGVKQLQPDVWDTFFEQHRVGDVHSRQGAAAGQLRRFRRDCRRGRGPVPQLRSGGRARRADQAGARQEHEFKIIKMNPAEKKVGLSIGRLARKRRAPMWRLTSSAASSTGGSTIGEFMSWKRASNENN